MPDTSQQLRRPSPGPSPVAPPEVDPSAPDRTAPDPTAPGQTVPDAAVPVSAKHVPMRRRGRSVVRDARATAHHYAPLAVIGAVIAGALALIVALVVSAGKPADKTVAAADPSSTGAATPAGQQVIGQLAAPTGYVPPTTDTRNRQDLAQPSAASTGLQKAPTEVLPNVKVIPGVDVKPVAGGWTPAIGVDIAKRALQWLNWPYSWDAGDANGPTYGHAVDADSRNDGSVRGFDCSGLVLYAMAKYKFLPHSAAAQYVDAGSVHPTFRELQPGDLIFWSENGSVSGISHVAIYVGNGLVVQAPHSGDVVRLTPILQVESGTIGTTRPLTA